MLALHTNRNGSVLRRHICNCNQTFGFLLSDQTLTSRKFPCRDAASFLLSSTLVVREATFWGREELTRSPYCTLAAATFDRRLTFNTFDAGLTVIWPLLDSFIRVTMWLLFDRCLTDICTRLTTVGPRIDIQPFDHFWALFDCRLTTFRLIFYQFFRHQVEFCPSFVWPPLFDHHGWSFDRCCLPQLPVIWPLLIPLYQLFVHFVTAVWAFDAVWPLFGRSLLIAAWPQFVFNLTKVWPKFDQSLTAAWP